MATVRGLLSFDNALPASVSFTLRGLPCVAMTNGHAFVYHDGMEAWMRVADWSWPASAYHPQHKRGGGGEVADKVASAQAARPRSMLLESVRAVRYPHPRSHLCDVDLDVDLDVEESIRGHIRIMCISSPPRDVMSVMRVLIAFRNCS
jgi:hypothetical protein